MSQDDEQRAAEARRAALERAFRSVFGSEGSRRIEQQLVLAHLSTYCRKHKTTFIPGDARSSGHLEGRREVLLEIERLVDVAPPTVRSLLAAMERPPPLEQEDDTP